MLVTTASANGQCSSGEPSWGVQIQLTQFAKKLASNIVWQPGSSTKSDELGTTDGEQSHLHAGNIQVPDLFRRPKSWQQFPKAQSLHQFWKFKFVKIIDGCGIEVAIPSCANPVNTSHVVFFQRNRAFSE